MPLANGNGPIQEKGRGFAKDTSGGTSLKGSHLIKPPYIRQYAHEGALYQEQANREPSRFELFFDLVFVAVQHQMAELVAEHADGKHFAVFFLLFFLPFSLWQDTRALINVSGTDDVLQRVYILVQMALMLGISANLSSFELPSLEPGAEEEGMDHWSPLHAAMLFFLVSKAIRLFIFLGYAAFMPRFRGALISSAAGLFFIQAVYFPLIFIKSETAFWAIAAVGIAVEIGSKYALAAYIMIRERDAAYRQADKHAYFPSINLALFIERTTLLVVVVLGEAILNITYRATAGEVGVHEVYGRCVLGLICAFLLTWLYFDQDSSHTFIHAARRHIVTAITHNWLLYPFVVALIFWSTALSEFVKQDDIEQGMRWYFSGSLATALAILCLWGWLHDNCDVPGSSLLPHQVRIFSRLAVAAVLVCLPLSDRLHDATQTLAISAALLTFQVLVETVGKIGARARSHEEIRAKLGQFENEGDQSANWEDLGLTELERGEEDAGVEGALTNMQKIPLTKRVRLALTAV